MSRQLLFARRTVALRWHSAVAVWELLQFRPVMTTADRSRLIAESVELTATRTPL